MSLPSLPPGTPIKPGSLAALQQRYSFVHRQDAIAAPAEVLLYLPAVVADDSERPDYLVTVDVDVTSKDYQTVPSACMFMLSELLRVESSR